MVDHEKEDAHEAEDTFDGGDDDGGDSLLKEALASGQAVQIFRKPKEGQQSRMTNIMGFFGGDEVPEDDIVTAEPASLYTMRQTARENLKAAQEKHNKTPPNHRGRRQVQRSHTFNADGRRGQQLQVKPTRSFSPTAPPRQGRRGSLSRSLTTNPHRDNSNNNNNNNNMYESAHTRTTYNGAHEDTIKRLTIQDDEIQQILQDPRAFGRLQKVLRKHGAVTNEVLKQVLPLYVKHQMNSQAAKEAERKKVEEDCKVRDRQAVVGAIQQHSARNLLV